MEDVRIGRKTTSAEKTVTLTTTAQILVPFSASRVALVIGPPATNVMSLSKLPNQAFGTGIIVGVQQLVLTLDIQRHGHMVQGPIYGVLNVGTDSVTFWETHLGDT